MSERILITGGAGFIGFHLAKRLIDEGYSVCLVDNHSRGIHDESLAALLLQPRVSIVEADMLDRDAVLALGTDYYAIFHLAAIIGVRHVLERPYDVLIHNTRMLENVITLAKHQSRFSRLLFASTSEVYAGTLKHFQLPVPTPENTALALTHLSEPRTSYMLSKIMGESMVHQSELPFTIFRPHNVYGPRMGMAHVVPEQLNSAFYANDGDSLPVYSSDHRRAFCYIDDAVEMLRRMLINEACRGATLNLGTQSPEVSIRDVVGICIDICGKQLKIDELSSTPGSPARRAPDMQKTNHLIGFESEIGLRQGIQETWAWYCDHVFIQDGATAR